MGLIYNRETKEVYEDIQYGSKGLDFLYHTAFGRVILKLLVSRTVSRIYGAYMSTSFSKRHIEGFIAKNHIDMARFEDRDFVSFRDFFIRKLKELKMEDEPDRFVAPADSKLLVYPIDRDLKIPVKKSIYTVGDMLGRDSGEVAEEYKNGTCLVFRLAVDDYHRYHFPDDGTVIDTQTINGCLHTISSFADDHKVFSRNYRVCNYLDTVHMGRIAMIEVGAMLVGRIVNHDCREFKKGQEKGYFEPGGSTIILLVGSNVKIDEDILENSRKLVETKVHCLESVGYIGNNG